MPFIEPISDDAASGPIAELFAEDRADHGYVANYTRVFAHRPDVFEAWQHLSGAIKQHMDLRAVPRAERCAPL